MYSRTAGNGRVSTSKQYQPSAPMPNAWNPESLFEPLTSHPEQNGPPYALPYASPTPPTMLPSPPSRSVVPVHVPVPGPFPDPSTLNQLRSPRSVSALADGRHVDNRPSRTLPASRSNLALNQWNGDPPQLGPGLPPPAPVSNTYSFQPQRAPPPSSLLNTRPNQPPPQKIRKSGFFSKLFSFGKSTHTEPTAPQPTKRLTKSTPPARPLSIISTDTASSAGRRQRAVLLKKPPTTRPMKHSSLRSVVTYHDGASPRQSNTYPVHHGGTQPNYPQMRPPEPATTSHVVNYVPPPTNINHMNLNHTTAVATPTHHAGPIPGNNNQPYPTHHAQRQASTDFSQHPGAGNGYGQYPSHSNGRHSGAQDSGYQSLVTTPSPTLCTVCNKNPQYPEPNNGKMSPYCSDLCKAAATAATPQTQRAECSYPGCTHPALMYPADHYWNYCSESHERHARRGCISCRQADDTGTQVCKRCRETFNECSPTIIPVPMDHDAFWNVVDKFSESWANPTKCPIFEAARVYKVMLTQERRDTYLGYRDTLEFYGRFTAKGKARGDERVLWCSLCSVVRGSAGSGKIVADSQAGRFGTGIYTFTKASKAIDYSGNDKGLESPWVALLLSKVAAGKGCVTRHENTTLTAPPQGYDSVIAEVRGHLNYDELVVYTYDAIRPTWLVMYQQK